MRRTVWALTAIAIFAPACAEQDELPAVQAPPAGARASLLPGRDDFAHRSFPSPLSVSDAEEILVRTEVFATGGMPPKRQVQAFNVLFDQPDAVTRFRSVVDRGHAAGRLYALCAFQFLSAEEAESLGADLARNEQRLVVYEHDVGDSLTPSEIMIRLRGRRLCEAMRDDRDETQRFFDEAG